MRIGVLGGTFDPPHVGHLILAEQARDQLNLEHVLWVPAGEPPHKQGQSISPTPHRLEMVSLAIGDNRAFIISDIDIARPGPHYTADMLEIVAQQFPGADLYFVVGGDSLRDIPTWHDPQRVVENANLAVMGRPGAQTDIHALESAVPHISSRISVLDTPLVNISGMTIRERIIKGNSIRYLVADSVGDYIVRNRLYLTSPAE